MAIRGADGNGLEGRGEVEFGISGIGEELLGWERRGKVWIEK